MSLVLAVAALAWGVEQVWAQSKPPMPPGCEEGQMRCITNADRAAAAQRARAARQNTVVPLAVPPQGGVPDYFSTTNANYANSPIIPKFVDKLPGLGPAAANLNGQFIPVAVPDTAKFSGSDYYEIGLVEYTEKMHSSLNPTRLRGYVQLVPLGWSGTDVFGNVYNAVALTTANGLTQNIMVNGVQAYGASKPHYLGPLIIAQGGTDPLSYIQARPVRIKFSNLLPTGTAGNLFIPVDTSYMGAGLSPFDSLGNPCDPTTSGQPGFPTCVSYTQNRATIHLHGGLTPWISDGTPHQWITPVGEPIPDAIKKGVSQQNVPDMWFDKTTHAVIPGVSLTPPNPNATNDPGPGSATFFYPNQQSARLMFYHDHAYGLTRLNVYAGEAAGYLVTDPVEQALVTAGTIPSVQIPLIIQDKTFVDTANILSQDPTWNWGSTPAVGGIVPPYTGDLWFPHVYLPNQNPSDMFGSNAIGRWDYGLWFWPPLQSNQLAHGEIPNPYYPGPGENPTIPGMGGNPSGTPESFMDTPLVNGTAYPVLTLRRAAYRFRILNAANDRVLNLQLYYANGGTGASATATVAGGVVTGFTGLVGGSGYTFPPSVYIIGGGGTGAAATTTVAGGAVTGITLTNPGIGYTSVPTVTIGSDKDVKMVPAILPPTLPPCAPGVTIGLPSYVTGTVTNPATGCWPETWPTDGRAGGVPDPTTVGPSWVVIGTEGGLLPQAAVVDNTPVGYEYGRRSITVLNVSNKSLFLGPAERADVIVDFSAVPAGSKLIMYNDAPAPVPAFDTRIDYYTGDPDQSMTTGDGTGGAPTTLPGFGPNTRTIMQIVINTGTGIPGSTFNLATLQTALPGAFAASQPKPIVPEPAFGPAYVTTFPGAYSKIFDTTLSFTNPLMILPQSVGSITITNGGSGYTTAPAVTITRAPGDTTGTGATASAFISAGVVKQIQINNGGFNYTLTPIVTIAPPATGTQAIAVAHLGTPMLPKAIQELFELNYGRMNATLGTELPFTNFNTQTTIPLGYIDPPTEIITNGEYQIWKITHNGVDTHAIHFHLFNVQIINRVGWDGVVKPPLPQEVGWKDTVIMNPLEDAIVALKPILPVVPFKLPDSVRPLDVTMPVGSTGQFSNIDPYTNNPITVTNDLTNFGWEYVWHCHILGHEENDMMRAMVFEVAPAGPTNLTATLATGPLRANLAWTNNWTTPAATSITLQRATDAAFTTNLVTTSLGPTVATSTDTAIAPLTTYYYRVRAENALGYSPWSNTVKALLLSTGSDPAVAWNSTDGKFQLAIRDPNNRIWVGTMNANGGFNNDWIQLPSGTTSAAPAIAWNPVTKKVQIATKGNGTNNVFVASYNADGTGLSSWTMIPANSLSAPAAAWNATTGKLQMAIRGTDNRINVGTVNGDGTGFSGWTQLPTGTTSAEPAIAWNPVTNKVQIATKGNGTNNVFVASYNANGTGLSSWTMIPANSLSAPAAAWNATTGKLQMAIRGTNNRINAGTVNGDGTGFSGWTQLPTGTTSAAPAIAGNPVTKKVQIATKGNGTNNVFVANMNPDGGGLSAWVQIN